MNIWKAATAVLAVVVVALIVTLGLTMGADGEEPTTASADSSAELGCQLLTEIPEDGYAEDEADMEEAHRLSVIGMLGYLAAAQNDEYDDLEETMGVMMEAGTRLTMTSEEFPGQLEAALETCADHGF